MTLRTLALDGIPIEDLNLKPVALDQWHSVPERSFGTVDALHYPGTRVTAIGSRTALRTFPLSFFMQPSSFTDRSARLDALIARFAGQVELTTADAPGRVLYVYLKAMPVRAPYNAFLHTDAITDLQLVAFDPTWYDRDPVIGSASAGNLVPLECADASIRRLLFYVCGAVTNPVVILRDQTGAEAQRMSFTITLGANDYLAVDCDRHSIVKVASGVITDQFDTLDPTQAFLTLQPPFQFTLECSGANLLTYHYRSYST